MKDAITRIISTKTFSQSLISFSGTAVSGVLGLIFFVLIARYLGPEDFGIFSVCITTISLLASIANVGVDTGIVRFVGKYIRSEKDKALKFFKLGLEIKIISSAIVLVLGWLLIPFLTRTVLVKPELLQPLRFSLLGVGTALLFSFTTSSAQALERFWIWSGLNIFSNLTRLLALLILFFLGFISVQRGLIIYILFPLLGFFIGLLFMPPFWKAKEEKSVVKEFFKYNKWVAISTVVVAISTRLDVFVSTRLLTLSEVGIYSVAVSLAGVVPQIINALATVVAPKLASFQNDTQALIYLKKLQLFVMGLAVLGLALGITIVYLIIPVIYGSIYSQSFTPFVILLFAQAIFLMSIPVHSAVYYYFSYPKLFVWVSIVHILIISTAGWFLISSFGYLGAAFTVFLGSISNLVIPGVWVLNKFKQK